jgi:hypothetical protein
MPLPLPSVTITIADNGANAAQTVPQQNVQVVLGCAVGGPLNTPVATSSPNTLQTTFVGGPLVEAAGLVCQAGGIAICVGLPIVTKGTAKAVQFTGTGSSVITVTLDGTNGAWDDFYVVFKCVAAGTIGTAGIQFQISLDAGRNFGAILNLGTATTYAIPNSGITLNFAAGTLVLADTAKFQTIAPAWNDAGVQAAINALAASQYGIAGWGSAHLVGVSASGDATNVQSYLNAITAQFIYSRMILDARDVGAPTAWGGSGETEVAWMTAIETNFSATDAKRVCVSAGFYNTPSPYPNSAAGAPSYRRALGWSLAVRRTQIPTQRRAGRVKDGSLANIAVNPSSDPSDGFVYHDERINPGLNGSRFATAITWPKKPGFYMAIENLMAAPGSQFTELVLGNVIDVACDIGYATGVEEVSDDLLLTKTGTLFPTDALKLQGSIDNALSAGMINVAMVSDASSNVSQTANVLATSNIPIVISVLPRGYANTISETINLVP